MSSIQEALETITSAVKSGRTDIVKSLIDACPQQGESGKLSIILSDVYILAAGCPTRSQIESENFDRWHDHQNEKSIINYDLI